MQSPNASKFDDLLYSLSNDLVNLQADESLGALRDAKPLVSGTMMKMSRSYSNTLAPSWKRRVVVISRNARIYLFRPSATTSSAPIGILSLLFCSGSFKETYNAHTLEVVGSNPNNITQTHKWTFKCNDLETMLIWMESIKAITDPSKQEEAKNLPEIKLSDVLSRHNSNTSSKNSRFKETGFSQRRSIAIDILQSQQLLEVSSDESTSNLETALSKSSLNLAFVEPVVARSSSNTGRLKSSLARRPTSGNISFVESVVIGEQNESDERAENANLSILQRSLSMGGDVRRKLSSLMKRSGSLKDSDKRDSKQITVEQADVAPTRRSWFPSLFQKKERENKGASI